jgi:hypothetical protein
MTQWYYLVDGQEVGPLDGSDLKRLAMSGQLKPSDKVRRADMVEMYQASQIKGLFQTKPPANPSAPATSTAGLRLAAATLLLVTSPGHGVFLLSKEKVIPRL